jgi:hypothetical protein
MPCATGRMPMRRPMNGPTKMTPASPRSKATAREFDATD